MNGSTLVVAFKSKTYGSSKKAQGSKEGKGPCKKEAQVSKEAHLVATKNLLHPEEIFC